MATLVGTQRTLSSLLRQLCELDLDAVEAYDAAIERIGEPKYKEQLRSFRADHVRHANELGAFMQQFGIAAPKVGDIKQVLTRGKVVLGSLVGDKAILFAMKTNEDDTNKAYERALARTDVPELIRHSLERNLQDERRHRAWMEKQIGDVWGDTKEHFKDQIKERVEHLKHAKPFSK